MVSALAGLVLAMAALDATSGALAPEALAEPPHRIVGNIFNVGEEKVPSFLIGTKAGWILIDTGYQYHSPRRILRNLERLSVQPDEIEIILATHAHRDHVGGHAQMRRSTGARILAMEPDAAMIASGGAGKFRWEPAPVDGVLADAGQVELGDVKLTAHLTPGHTRGATSWSLQVSDGAGRYDVLILDSALNFAGTTLVANADYPQIAEDYRKSLELLQQLPCDILLDPHGGFYGRMRERVADGGWDATRNPFVDPQGCSSFLRQKAADFAAELQRQKDRVAQ